jgi:hypothetical protein
MREPNLQESEEARPHQVTLSVFSVCRRSQSGGSWPRPARTQAIAIPRASNAATISKTIDMRLSPSDLEPTMVNYRLQRLAAIQ